MAQTIRQADTQSIIIPSLCTLFTSGFVFSLSTLWRQANKFKFVIDQFQHKVQRGDRNETDSETDRETDSANASGKYQKQNKKKGKKVGKFAIN